MQDFFHQQYQSLLLTNNFRGLSYPNVIFFNQHTKTPSGLLLFGDFLPPKQNAFGDFSLPNKTPHFCLQPKRTEIQAKRPRRVLEPVGVLHANLSQASTCTSDCFGADFRAGRFPMNLWKVWCSFFGNSGCLFCYGGRVRFLSFF